MTHNQAFEKGREAGKQAFKNGLKCVPALDPAHLVFVRELQLACPTGNIVVRKYNTYLDGWHQGWAEANAAEPVPKTAAEPSFTKEVNKVMEESREIGKTIFQQLGAHRFKVMTGAKNFVVMKRGIKFDIGTNEKKIRSVIIKLTPRDDYTMEFWKGVKNPQKVKEVEGVYCDMLQEIFTENTGLYTSL